MQHNFNLLAIKIEYVEKNVLRFLSYVTFFVLGIFFTLEYLASGVYNQIAPLTWLAAMLIYLTLFSGSAWLFSVFVAWLRSNPRDRLLDGFLEWERLERMKAGQS